VFQRPLIAIDIGSTAIKVVELGGRAEKKLNAAALEQLPPEAFVDGQIKDTAAITELLKEILKGLKINPLLRRAAIGIGGNSLIVKKIKIPNGPEADMAQQVSYEAEQQFQGDLSNLYWDHFRVDQEPDAAGNIGIIIVAAHRDIVEQRLSIIHGAGLRGGVVECDVFAATNMFEYNYGVSADLVGLLNIGASATSVALVSGGQYLFNRELSLGGEEYTRRLMDVLKLDHANAESLKLSVSQGEGRCPPEAQRAINDLNEQLASEIQQSITFYFQSGDAPAGVSKPAYLFVHGGGSRTLGLDAALAGTLQTPVHIVNPFQRVHVNPSKMSLDYAVTHGRLFGVAVGLGLRQIHDNR
jgi:type IV pilus assembly protein PilM